MPKSNDLSRSLALFEQNSPLIAVIEMSLSSWLVAGIGRSYLLVGSAVLK